MAKDLLIKGGRVIDPATNRDETADILVADGKIAGIEAGIIAEDAEVLDASGMIVMPGLIDMHVHLRIGFEERGHR